MIDKENSTILQEHWRRHNYPFIGLPDPENSVASRYGQEVSLLKLGRMPALLVVDKDGRMCYRHYGRSMHDIPGNEEILTLLDRLNEKKTTECKVIDA